MGRCCAMHMRARTHAVYTHQLHVYSMCRYAQCRCRRGRVNISPWLRDRGPRAGPTGRANGANGTTKAQTAGMARGRQPVHAPLRVHARTVLIRTTQTYNSCAYPKPYISGARVLHGPVQTPTGPLRIIGIIRIYASLESTRIHKSCIDPMDPRTNRSPHAINHLSSPCTATVARLQLHKGEAHFTLHCRH